MPKLNPEHQIKVNKRELQKILEAYDLRLKKFTIAKGGIENTTFLIDTDRGKYALRVYRKKNKSFKDISLEIDFMDYLRKYKLPVPRVFPNTTRQPITHHEHVGVVWRCILMEFMKGKHPSRYSKSLLLSLPKTHARMHQLGIEFAKKHKNKPVFVRVLREGYFTTGIKLKPNTDPNIRTFLDRIKRFKLPLPAQLPKGFNHLDFDHANIFVEKDRISAILDFDDLSYSPIIVCVAYTLWDILYLTREPKAVINYLREYQKYRPLKKLELGMLRDVLQFRNYVVAAMQMRFYGAHTASTYIKFEKIISSLKVY